jgi:hypothetical protein
VVRWFESGVSGLGDNRVVWSIKMRVLFEQKMEWEVQPSTTYITIEHSDQLNVPCLLSDQNWTSASSCMSHHFVTTGKT